jgi:predicted nicotinamide N-methyase
MLKLFRKIGAKYAMNVINNHPKISRIAEVLDLNLEPGKINIAARLKGEADSISVSANYAIQNNVICISDVMASKEWINGLADIFKEKYSKIDLNVLSKNEFVVKILKQLL